MLFFPHTWKVFNSIKKKILTQELCFKALEEFLI